MERSEVGGIWSENFTLSVSIAKFKRNSKTNNCSCVKVYGFVVLSAPLWIYFSRMQVYTFVFPNKLSVILNDEILARSINDRKSLMGKIEVRKVVKTCSNIAKHES